MTRGDCLLCGAPGQVETLLVRWREPIGADEYTAIPRCVDRVACRSRVELAGDDWPVDDGTPATVRRPEPMPIAVEEPAVAEPVDEVPSWL